MTALTRTAIAAVRARFGIYADAIMALRAAGETVAPYSDKFRVGTGDNMWVCTGDEILAMAAKLQARQEANRKRMANKETAAGHQLVGAHEGTPEASRDGSVRADYSDATPCGCVDGNGSGSTPPDPVVPPVTKSQAGGGGSPTAKPVPTAGIGAGTLNGLLAKARTHVMTDEELVAQRASFVRGQIGMGSDADEAEYRRRMRCGETLHDTPSGAPPETAPQTPRRCSKCGGPRSRWANDLCRKCYRARQVAPKAQAVRIAALECEVDALKSTVERMRAQLAMEQGR